MNFNAACILAALAVFAMSTMSDAQTFHYSHGWTNGKRSVLAPLPQRRSVPAAQSKPIEADYDVKVEYGQGAEEENRVKSFLHKSIRSSLLKPVELGGPLVLLPAATKSGARREQYQAYTLNLQRLAQLEAGADLIVED